MYSVITNLSVQFAGDSCFPYFDPCQLVAVRIRRWHDFTAVLLIISANVVAIILAVKHHPELIQVNSLVAVASSAVIVVSVAMVLWPFFTRR